MRPCFIVDMSLTGAQLRLQTAETIPDRFKLLLSRDESVGRLCQIRWRRGLLLGVAFI